MTVNRRIMLQILVSGRGLAQITPGNSPKPLLTKLCDLIIPGAVSAGAPQYIELLCSENADYQREIEGGLLWLDADCRDRYGKSFLDCTSAQQTETLDRIAYRENGSPGTSFFALVREFTMDAYFTSREGIDYLGFRGNSPLRSFPGCPNPDTRKPAE